MDKLNGKFYNTAEFKALDAKWKAKLKRKGFNDIEQDENYLKIWDCLFFRSNYGLTQFQAKEEYYRLAGIYMNEHKFVNAFEKKVWELHSSGSSVREIVAKMKSLGHKAYINKVYYAIQRNAKEMLKGINHEQK